MMAYRCRLDLELLREIQTAIAGGCRNFAAVLRNCVATRNDVEDALVHLMATGRVVRRPRRGGGDRKASSSS